MTAHFPRPKTVSSRCGTHTANAACRASTAASPGLIPRTSRAVVVRAKRRGSKGGGGLCRKEGGDHKMTQDTEGTWGPGANRGGGWMRADEATECMAPAWCPRRHRQVQSLWPGQESRHSTRWKTRGWGREVWDGRCPVTRLGRQCQTLMQNKEPTWKGTWRQSPLDTQRGTAGWTWAALVACLSREE